jgi:hypothetical protein
MANGKKLAADYADERRSATSFFFFSDQRLSAFISGNEVVLPFCVSASCLVSYAVSIAM